MNPAEQAIAMLDATADDLEQAQCLAKHNALNVFMEDGQAFEYWRRVLLNLVPAAAPQDWN
jgi:hypothetical protein